MKKSRASGFTLIELAIVILLIGILAAVALPRFSNVSKQAQISVARDLLTRLNSSLAIYIAEQQDAPQDFTDFVAPTGSPTGGKTISLEGTQRNGKMCQLQGSTIDCGDVLSEIKPVTYTFSNRVITLNCQACN